MRWEGQCKTHKLLKRKQNRCKNNAYCTRYCFHLHWELWGQIGKSIGFFGALQLESTIMKQSSKGKQWGCNIKVMVINAVGNWKLWNLVSLSSDWDSPFFIVGILMQSRTEQKQYNEWQIEECVLAKNIGACSCSYQSRGITREILHAADVSWCSQTQIWCVAFQHVSCLNFSNTIEKSKFCSKQNIEERRCFSSRPRCKSRLAKGSR